MILVRPTDSRHLALANTFLDILKKQAAQNSKQYDELATKYNAATGAVSDKRKD